MASYKFEEMDYYEINKTIEKCNICVLGTSDYGVSYLTPVYFEYKYSNDSCTFIIESKDSGRKIKNIVNNNNVSVFIQYDENDCFKTIFAAGNAYIKKMVNSSNSCMVSITIKISNISGRNYYK